MGLQHLDDFQQGRRHTVPEKDRGALAGTAKVWQAENSLSDWFFSCSRPVLVIFSLTLEIFFILTLSIMIASQLMQNLIFIRWKGTIPKPGTCKSIQSSFKNLPLMVLNSILLTTRCISLS